tara:strand:+ start:366 stop:1598 length:1233 start_codon:yes stop_codon:yes gene_type:complete
MLLIRYVFGVCFFLTGYAHAESGIYTCPMHLNYVTEEFGGCPLCGMDLVKFKRSQTPDVPLGIDDEISSRMPVTMSPETIQKMGVRTENVGYSKFGASLRSYGLVKENTRLRNAVSGRVAGWIENLKITALGDRVNKGQLLFTLYSPDLILAQQDFFSALATRIDSRILSGAERLRSLGVSDLVIYEIRSKGIKLDHIPFYSEVDGVVSHLSVSKGSYIQPGDKIATIQDYSSVWIEVSVAEKDLQFISEKSEATVTFPNLGNVLRLANIDYIYPTVNEKSRTGTVRLVLENSGGLLKPGAYADVIFETDVDMRLSIPSEAILKSSRGDFVIIAQDKGRFLPRNIQTGIQSDGRSEVTKGLSEGERVVVSSQFLIDSESSLRESFHKMQTPNEVREPERIGELIEARDAK